MAKAQSDIISALLVIIIAIGLVSTVYIWGVPLIQKQQDTALAQRVFDNFNPDNSNSVTKRMQYVANFGGDEIYTMSTDGVWQLNTSENSLQFSFLSKVSNWANFSIAGWIPVSQGANCNSIFPGTLGTDTSFIVCVKSENQPEGKFLITYKVYFRDLNDPSTGNIYRVTLVPGSSTLVSSFKSIRITKVSTLQQGSTITVQLKILLQ